MFSDLPTGDLTSPASFQTKASSRRAHPAVLGGPVWSADLAETLSSVYGPLLEAGWSLEDLARMLRESESDGSGD